MNRAFERPIAPVADAVFLIDGDRNQDDVELFQELWRQHHAQDVNASVSEPADPLPRLLIFYRADQNAIGC